MRVFSGFLVGITFGLMNVSVPLVQSHYGYYLPPVVQPIASGVILVVLGALAQCFLGPRQDGGRSLPGWAWLLIVVVVSSLIVTGYAYGRSLAAKDYFIPQLQVIGLLVGLAVAFFGYGLSWIIRTALKESEQQEWRPRG